MELPSTKLSITQDRRNQTRSARSNFVVLPVDVAILSSIFEHRFLRRDQLSVLVGRHAKRLHRRLLKLERRGYLTTIRFPQQKHIYALGRFGIAVLVEQGFSEPSLLSQRQRTRELKALFLKHEMMIVDVHVSMSLAAREGKVSLVHWSEGKGLNDSVVALDRKGSKRLPIRPDAFFSLEDSHRPEGANRAHFALEADRSTTTQTRFEAKIRAYWHYIEQGLHPKKFGVKSFRVLTVTLTDARAKNLCGLAASVVPERGRKYFLFAPFDRMASKKASLFRASTCYSARAATTCELCPLVPMPNGLQKDSGVV